MDSITILYFLEDRAQEGFIKALVQRRAVELGIDRERIEHKVLSGRGGSRLIGAFKDFLAGYETSPLGTRGFVVVVIDGNCRGFQERKRELDKHVRTGHPFSNRIVFAIPDPHIERWYMLDQKAIKEAVELDRAPELPKYKCEKNYYKSILHQSLKDSDIGSLLGGSEYAEDIVREMEDLMRLGQQDKSFGAFVSDLSQMLKSVSLP